ncbi:hypothetical protein [Streptomyces lycii]
MSGGSIATGRYGTARSVNTTGSAPDPAHRRLLEAIAALRAALPADDRSDADTALDGELSRAEDEIAANGTVERSRLADLLDRVSGWLGTQAPAAAAVASATAVVQGIAQLLR